MLDFFEVFAEKCKLNSIQKNKGLYLLNIVLLDINLSQISGSVIAYSIINIVTRKDCSFLLKKINQVIDKRNEKNKEEYDELNTINKGYKEEINLLKKELEFKCFNLNEDEFIKILKLQRDKMKEELINQIKNDNRAYNQNIREYQEKIINLQEETKKSRELEQILISRLNQLNNLFSRNL